MNGNRHVPTQPSADHADGGGVTPDPVLSHGHVASRRYMLLKGFGKGAAILAAAAPIKTLASTPSITANGMICTVSGTQSAVHSQATQLPTCGGLRPFKYKDIKNWPNYSATSNPKAINYAGSYQFSEKTKFSSLFGSGLSNALLWIMQNRPNSDESHWIAALLNAIKAPSGYVFPYTPEEVLALYKGAQRDAALTFFKGFMETV